MRDLSNAIGDYFECPHCYAENGSLGGGSGRPDRYFNACGTLWGVCDLHRVRWAVTRALLAAGIPDVRDVPGSDLELEEVECVVLHRPREY